MMKIRGYKVTEYIDDCGLKTTSLHCYKQSGIVRDILADE